MTIWSIEDMPMFDASAAAALGGALKRGDDVVPPSSRAGAISVDGRRRRSSDVQTPEEALPLLHSAQAAHPFWQNRLFRACAAGQLTREDYRFIFAQYYLYSKNFTRYLAALMASCESDYHRARLAENLWEEGGGIAPEKRHAEIFRRFMREGLSIDIDDIDFLDSTRFFVREYLDFCLHSHPVAASAFLSLGTEGIVPRMYAVMVDGLLKAGIPEEHITFFRIHMECDDEHAETLEQIMVSYFGMPDWFNTCMRSMSHALSIRQRFFEQLYDAIELRRVRQVLHRIQAGESLAPLAPKAAQLRHAIGAEGLPLYANVNERLGIDFSVERVPFDAEVFDARILRIAPHKNNERHKHPHESVFHVVSGRGRVHVDEASLEVGPGDIVFVPRWAMHQSFNTTDDELVVLALTDFGLTEKAFIGNHLKTTRLKGIQEPRHPDAVPDTKRV